jgi:hypothetical protein
MNFLLQIYKCGAVEVKMKNGPLSALSRLNDTTPHRLGHGKDQKNF